MNLNCVNYKYMVKYICFVLPLLMAGCFNENKEVKTMQKSTIELPEIKLVGIKTQTNNKNETDPSTAKIAPTIQTYFQTGVSEKITNRKNPWRTFCVYTNYESDFNGEYTYFVGEEVTSFDNLPHGLETLSIHPQTYSKFTTESGSLPNIVLKAWQEIWHMKDHDLGGKRTYNADFEIYDNRAQDPTNSIIDIYIGIK